MLEIVVTIEGQEKLEQALGALVGSLRDLRPFWPEASKAFSEIERRRFDNEGYGWAELSTAYAAIKAVRFPGRPILQASGALYQSLTDEKDDHAIFEMTADSMTRGTDLPYASYHQTGTSRIPARPPIDLRDEDERLIGVSIAAQFEDFADRLGFEVTAGGAR